jgi:hypothetical protein
MADGINPAVLKAAVKDALDGIATAGRIETRQGGSETWIENAQPQQAFWEISIPSINAVRYAGGGRLQENPVIRIEGWMPFDYTRDTQTAFEAIWYAMLNIIRDDMTFGGVLADGEIPGLPLLTTNELGPYRDIEGARIVHHAVIEVVGDYDFIHG